VRARSFGWLLVYLMACAALLAAVGFTIVRHRQDLLDLLAAYFLPESWRYAARSVAERFWKAQDKRVLLNACVGASLTVLALLFPLKEKLSAAVEADARLTPEPGRALPLWLQAFEEGWLALVFATAQMSLFWIGYPPVKWRQELALGLSWAVLFASAGMSFLAPTWQRHRLRYFTIWKRLLKRPITFFGFGALFTLGPVYTGRYALSHGWPVERAILAIGGAAVVSVALATVVGTFVAARGLGRAATTHPPHFLTRALVNLALLALFAANVWLYGTIALSLHHKSQLLKCHYRLAGLKVDLPELSRALLQHLELKLNLDLEIENPTDFDVEIERNRLEVKYEGALVARSSISPLAVPAHQTRRPHVEIPIALDTSVLKKGRQLFDKARWTATFYLTIAEDFELPIYLLK
jgi:hypothetical protein